MNSPPAQRAIDAAAMSTRCALIGLLVGGAGAVWILATHRAPLRALLYHVPLAVLFGIWASQVLLSVRGTWLWWQVGAGVVTAMLIAGRLTWDWPLSGHGVLGALIYVLAPARWQSLCAVGVVLGAFACKWVWNQDPWAVVWGACVGAGLGLLAWAGAHRASEAKRHDLGAP